MDHISYMKAKVKFEHWEKVIEDCQTSGKTVVAYCNENEVNIKSYYYWLRKIREQACKNINFPASLEENKCEFAQIQPVIAYQQAVPMIKLHIGKIIVEISDGMSQDTISYVLNGIRNIC